ncbi:MAG: HAMP domain-containing protein [Nitrospirae bacterium]|nr:HAMP domain-containing protein [Nitrospirota bacterium]
MSIYVAEKFQNLKEITGSILTINEKMSSFHKKLVDAFLSQVRYERKFLVLKDKTLYEHFIMAKNDFDQYYNGLVSLTDSHQMKNLLENIRQSHDHYEEVFSKEIELLRDGQSYPEDLYMQEKEKAINETMDGLKEIKTYTENRTYEKIKQLGEAGADARRVALIMTVSYLIFGIAVSIFITRSITRPLKIMRKKTSEVAAGNYSGNLSLTSPPEIGKLAKDFNFMCNKLKEIDKLKSDFLSFMSHELRTPLTSIKEGSTLLLEGVGGEVTEKQKRLLTIIREETDRLIGLVNSLLDLSKMEAGMMTYNYAYEDISHLINKAVIALEPISESKDIRLEREIENDLQRVKIDSDRILQVLRNLLGNAVKFTPKGGHIKISARAIDKAVEVSVSDTGIGIPKENLHTIFNKFQQASNKSPDIVKGTGLGLAIVKHIINAHGGKIWVESEPGHGSTFTFVLSA